MYGHGGNLSNWRGIAGGDSGSGSRQYHRLAIQGFRLGEPVQKARFVVSVESPEGPYEAVRSETLGGFALFRGARARKLDLFSS